MKTSAKAMNETSKAVGGGFSVHFSMACSACYGASKSVKREFSDQAWAALLSWSEIHDDAVDQPICNDCYFNLRDVLIDRAGDIDSVANASGKAKAQPSVIAINA